MCLKANQTLGLTLIHRSNEEGQCLLKSYVWSVLALIQELKDMSRHGINRGNRIYVSWILWGFICWFTRVCWHTALSTREIGKNGLLRAYKGFLVKNEFINTPNYWKPLKDFLAIDRVVDLLLVFFLKHEQNNPFERRKAEQYCCII